MMRKVLVAVLALLPVAASLYAQEWSAEQKEVWKNVEAYTALYAQGDLEGYLGYLHPAYCSWAYGSPMPNGKTSIQKWLDHDIKTNKTLILQISPVAIQVYGSFAFVHYYYNGLVKDAEGKDKASSGRWTDILTKQGDRWVVIGDHGGQTSKE